jgi:ABC-type glycerol-3-phosphate transport system substrate-binding protein
MLVCICCLAVLSSSSLAKTPITWWMHWQGPAEAWVKEWAVQFEKENPDIQLTVETQTPNPNEKLMVTVAAGVGPDVSYVVDTRIGNWAEIGLTLPLNRFFNRMPNRNDFLPDVIDAMTYEGELQAMPFMVWPWGVLWNRIVFAEAGMMEPPKDWNEMLGAARRLTRLGSDGTVERWGWRTWRSSQWMLAMLETLLRQLDTTLLAEMDTKARLNHAEGIRAMDYLHELWQMGDMQQGQAASDVALVDGKGGMFYAWSGANWQDLIKARPEVAESDTLGFFRYPGPVQGRDNLNFMAANLMIVSSSKHPDEAWRVIESFVQPRNLKQYLMVRGMLPIRRSLFADPDLQRSPFTKEMMSRVYSPLLLLGIKHKRFSDFQTPAGTQLMQGLDGTIAIPEALMRAEHAIDVELTR